MRVHGDAGDAASPGGGGRARATSPPSRSHARTGRRTCTPSVEPSTETPASVKVAGSMRPGAERENARGALEPKWLEPKWLEPKWLRIYLYIYIYLELPGYA